MIQLPHPNDWRQRYHFVPARVGELSLDVRCAQRQFGTPPYHRHYEAMFALDELAISGEIVIVSVNQPFATGLIWRDGRAVPMKGAL